VLLVIFIIEFGGQLLMVDLILGEKFDNLWVNFFLETFALQPSFQHVDNKLSTFLDTQWDLTIQSLVGRSCQSQFLENRRYEIWPIFRGQLAVFTGCIESDPNV
jgi:hypothetical protein